MESYSCRKTGVGVYGSSFTSHFYVESVVLCALCVSVPSVSDPRVRPERFAAFTKAGAHLKFYFTFASSGHAQVPQNVHLHKNGGGGMDAKNGVSGHFVRNGGSRCLQRRRWNPTFKVRRWGTRKSRQDAALKRGATYEPVAGRMPFETQGEPFEPPRISQDKPALRKWRRYANCARRGCVIFQRLQGPGVDDADTRI
jgi:hypothetical protein